MVAVYANFSLSRGRVFLYLIGLFFALSCIWFHWRAQSNGDEQTVVFPLESLVKSDFSRTASSLFRVAKVDLVARCIFDLQIRWCQATEEAKEMMLEYRQQSAGNPLPFSFPLLCPKYREDDPPRLRYTLSTLNCMDERGAFISNFSSLWNERAPQKLKLEACEINFRHFKLGSRLNLVTQTSRSGEAILHVLLPTNFNASAIADVADPNTRERVEFALLATVRAAARFALGDSRTKVYVYTADPVWFAQRYPFSLLRRVVVKGLKSSLLSAVDGLHSWYRQVFNKQVDGAAMEFAYKLAILYRYGGVMLDRDIIPLSHPGALPKDTLFQSDAGAVNPSIMAFEKGHPTLERMASSFTQALDKDATRFSPKVFLTRFYDSYCVASKQCESLKTFNDRLIEGLPIEKSKFYNRHWLDECPTYRWLLEASVAIKVPAFSPSFDFLKVRERTDSVRVQPFSLVEKVINDHIPF